MEIHALQLNKKFKKKKTLLKLDNLRVHHWDYNKLDFLKFRMLEFQSVHLGISKSTEKEMLLKNQKKNFFIFK